MLTKRFLVAVMAGAIMAGSTVAAYGAIVPTSPDKDQPLVTSRPGALNVRPIPWQQARTLDERTVRVSYTSGVEPCYVLDRVTVEYSADKVTITLYEGSDPTAQGRACIAIATQKEVDVKLTEPLRQRALVDGAERR